MGPVFRGIKNVFRSPLRSVVVLVLLTVSITMVLVMIQVRGSVDMRLAELRETVGTDIQVRPVGASQGVGQPLTDSDIEKLKGLEHVVAVDGTLQAQYSGEALQSAIDLSAFGDHEDGESGGIFGSGSTRAPRMIPISFSGVNSLDRPQLLDNRFGAGSGDEFTITDGRSFTPEEQTAGVVVIGETLAEKNGLTVGSLLILEETEPLEVIGIFSTGNQWGDNTVFMPLEMLRMLMGVEDLVSSVTVYVDSVDDLELVSAEITRTLGAGRVDVTSDLEIVERQSESLASIRGTSSAGTIAALAGAGGVILLAMFLLVRERTREIGILKAIGASWGQIVAQFSAESLTLSVISGVAGFGLAIASAQTVAARFFDPSPQVSSVGGFSGFQHGTGGGAQHEGFGGFFGDRFSSASLGPLDISVSPDLLVYALGAAVVLSLLGSVLAAVYIARLKPAEVLRNE